MKRVQDFRTDSPRELKRQLGQLEENASAAITESERDRVPRKVYARHGETIQARTRTIVVCDDGSSPVVMLGKSTEDSQFVIVMKRKAAGTVTVRGIDCKVNDGPAQALTSIGTFPFTAIDGDWTN